MEEYVRRVFEAIRSDEDLETLQPNIGEFNRQISCHIPLPILFVIISEVMCSIDSNVTSNATQTCQV